jgi:hypothetical protein
LRIWLETDPATLKTRVSARSADASDATAEVVDLQLRQATGSLEWVRANASGVPGEVLARAMRILTVPSDLDPGQGAGAAHAQNESIGTAKIEIGGVK